MSNLKSINYFLAVAKSLNISQAADALYISQQALSNQIKRLEDEYNTTFFDRTPSLKLTKAGEAMVYYCQQRILLENWLESTINNKEQLSFNLNLGMSETRSQYFLPNIINIATKRLPNVKIRQINCMATSYHPLLANGTIDFYLGVSSSKIYTPDQEVVKLGTEKVYIGFKDDLLEKYYPEKNQILSALNKQFNIHLIDKMPFINFELSSQLAYVIHEYMLINQVSPHIIYESESLTTVFDLCLRGYGVGFLSSLIVDGVKHIPDDFHIYPLFDINTDSDLIIAYNKTLPLSEIEASFLDLVKELYLANEKI